MEDQIILMLHFPMAKIAGTSLGLFLVKWIISLPDHHSFHHFLSHSQHWGQVPAAICHSSCNVVFCTLKGRGNFNFFGTNVPGKHKKLKDTTKGKSYVLRLMGNSLISPWYPVYFTDFASHALCLKMAIWVLEFSLRRMREKEHVIFHRNVLIPPHLVCIASMQPGSRRSDRSVCHLACSMLHVPHGAVLLCPVPHSW